MARAPGPARLILPALLAFGGAACGGSSHPAAVISSHDRAACVQLDAAYARFNSPAAATASSIRLYRRTIATASAADDAQLRGAITLWASRMLHPATATATAGAVPGAAYASQRCAQIGNPLTPTSTKSSNSSDSGD